MHLISLILIQCNVHPQITLPSQQHVILNVDVNYKTDFLTLAYENVQNNDFAFLLKVWRSLPCKNDIRPEFLNL